MDELLQGVLEIICYVTGRLLLPVISLGRIEVASLRESVGRAGAFSSEAGPGSRREKASKRKTRTSFRFNRNGKGSRIVPTKSTSAIVVGDDCATLAGFVIWGAMIALGLFLHHLRLF
jgi:hypothetical protein